MKKLCGMLLSAFISVHAFAHGENKAGPHGGYIQMPANFHTEVVPLKNGNLKIYLIDLQFENPVVKNSDVQAVLAQGKKNTKLKCEIKADHFECKGAKDLKTGTLSLQATREGVKASMNAEYKLPFVPFTEENSSKKPDHSMSH